MQRPPKPQFARWLIEQVETGQYQGLRYVGQNKFRVPWKHNSRKDCNDEDSKIFRAWAVASGKIHEFPNDKARWKTNFRCVLNNLKERFKMVQDNSENAEDPHKIYEIINTESNTESLQTQGSPEDSGIIPNIYSSSTDYFPSASESNLLNNFMAMDLGNESTEQQQQWTQNYTHYNPAVPVDYPDVSGADNNTQFQPDHACCYEANPEPALDSPPQLTIFDLEISIHYRKREMLNIRLSTCRLQLHYHQEAPELNAHHLCFPDTVGLLDHKQIDYTTRILHSIQKGLLLEVRDTGIYACRQDRCHVFASTSDPNVAQPDPRKLPQNTMVELLNFKTYANELKQFRENNSSSPNYIINMCFGEKFPDGKPLEKKLIVVKVVPLICRHLHEMAQLDGASSLHSSNISLQISHNSLYDLINAAFDLPIAMEPMQAAMRF
ncbi:interferon regulatory factor 7 [Thalassophryne amazonica]|uniref:interferon regulatory factor 7 n=1 Tax=Thalassophryne amazonica TaxID=390379 RepID=UPI001471B2C2|nr:interferon regulatory factor 7 [Thalassophryne amazonica]